ncbi:hypothetical protein KEF85_14765 [Methylomonas paludis]|uniref:Uncharacterized protein n=1 Tax=Methylomonas paludis TaxID=1173101 RepID=A0A975MMJ4_9GAMM|nr:hypothetical protein [Methylomonas paludis]QWF70570.1 hypothetical protein KEF85_14765 [Methylomonas paludis]
MQLREFIKETLTQIVDGVRDAQEPNGGAFIVPAGDGGHKYADHPRFSASARLKSTIVDFDVAITAEDSDKVEGSGGIRVLSIQFGAKGEAASKDTTVSRIQFAVPLLLPESQREWHKEGRGNE